VEELNISDSNKHETAESYKQASDQIKRELSDWSKYSWGIFLGGLAVASFMDPAQYDNAGFVVPNAASRIGSLLGIALLGAYFWRKHALEKRLSRIWQFMPKRERDRSLGFTRDADGK
jgi:hypothetical protein